ncbi:MAG: DUF1330 domain-containing protein [Cohaesibacteraceae bacterium]|nr:DUF1330 domain-containing protein [Cohaesibacteraceae bacterium]MBL4876367.1 DUF1330 domain-containing protein [Cohaesibacteraceae bacterium]
MAVFASIHLTITNPEKLAEYRKHAGPAVQKYGGKAVSTHPAPVVLEAAETPPTVMVIVEFPTLDHAKGWFDDPDLAYVHALRNEAGLSTIVVNPAS